MELEPIIRCFSEEFERFWAMMEKQVEICPEGLWGVKAGGYVYWQQIWHAMVIAELNAIENPEAKALSLDKYSRGVALLSDTLDRVPSKAEILEEAGRIKKLAMAYYESLSLASLSKEHPAMSKRLGKPHTRLHAALSTIRHLNYHIGACDAVLRERGLTGVY
ncbi:MAG: DinB family protein [Desulfovibrionaceae bacterium]|nr:DinB family protein [Desulfovibrionaceae bacterium]